MEALKQQVLFFFPTLGVGVSSGKPDRFPDPPCPCVVLESGDTGLWGRGHTQGLVRKEMRGAPAALSPLDSRLGRLAGC